MAALARLKFGGLNLAGFRENCFMGFVPVSARAHHAASGGVCPRGLRRPASGFLCAAFLSTALLLWPLAGVTPAFARGPDSLADLADCVTDAVVNISATQTLDEKHVSNGPQLEPGTPFDDLFEEFFRRHQQQGGREAPEAKPRERKSNSLGSGFIIDPSGIIITNNHVIADANEVTVILTDGQKLKAEVIGKDEKVDVAVLRVKPDKPLKAVKFGDSEKMRVGDWVVAVGNPFGLGGSVTAGIISARHRDIASGPYDNYFQTDAAINKGNSGGPLFNMKGEVVGINTAIFSPSGGSIGIGFSIPANEAKPVLADLQQFGKTRRGWLGVRIQSVTPDIADSLGLKEQKGALVAGVTANGPAEKAGIKTGDVILDFDGKSVEDMRHLPRIVAETPIDRQVDVHIWRDGKPVTVKAVVGELPEEEQATQTKTSEAPKSKTEAGQSEISGLGFSVATMNQSLRERYDLPADAKGVVVTDVKANGAAADKGLRPGDIVVEAMQEPVKAPADLVDKVAAAKKAGRKSVLLLVQNDAGLHFVPLRFGGSESESQR